MAVACATFDNVLWLVPKWRILFPMPFGVGAWEIIVLVLVLGFPIALIAAAYFGARAGARVFRQRRER